MGSGHSYLQNQYANLNNSAYKKHYLQNQYVNVNNAGYLNELYSKVGVIAAPGVPGVPGVPGAAGVAGVPGVPGVPAVGYLQDLGFSIGGAVGGVKFDVSKLQELPLILPNAGIY